MRLEGGERSSIREPGDRSVQPSTASRREETSIMFLRTVVLGTICSAMAGAGAVGAATTEPPTTDSAATRSRSSTPRTSHCTYDGDHKVLTIGDRGRRRDVRPRPAWRGTTGTGRRSRRGDRHRGPDRDDVLGVVESLRLHRRPRHRSDGHRRRRHVADRHAEPRRACRRRRDRVVRPELRHRSRARRRRRPRRLRHGRCASTRPTR